MAHDPTNAARQARWRARQRQKQAALTAELRSTKAALARERKRRLTEAQIKAAADRAEARGKRTD